MPGTQGCPIVASENGSVANTTAPLCDKIISDDAILKLRLAASYREKTGRPFFLAAGFRKPHMPWRFPEPFLSHYPDVSNIATAAHPTLHVSVPPIAHHSPDLGSQNGASP